MPSNIRLFFMEWVEVSISQMRPEIDDIKETQDKHIRIIDKQETHHHNVEGRLRNLENSNRQLEDQNIEIREKLLMPRSLLSCLSPSLCTF
jgi:septal ring factor EnvC (AmiA/AmiB activator)